MWRFGFFGIGFVPTLVLMLALGLGLKSGIPEMADKVRSSVDKQVEVSVHEAFVPARDARISGNRYVVTEASLDRAMYDADLNDGHFGGVTIELRPGMVLLVNRESRGQETIPIMSGSMAVENGRVVIQNRNGIFDSIYSSDALADAVESELRALFARNDVTPIAVTISDSAIVFELKPGPGSADPRTVL